MAMIPHSTVLPRPAGRFPVLRPDAACVWAAWLPIIAFSAFAGTPPPAASIPPLARIQPAIRVQWADPVTGAPLSDVFTGDCLVCPGGSHAVATPVAPWTRLRTGPAEPWHSGLRLRAPGGPGPLVASAVELSDAAGRTAGLSIWLCAPWNGSLGVNQYGLLRVADAELGLYPPPARAAAAKVRNHPGAYTPPRLFLPVRPETFDLLVAGRLRAGDLLVPSEEFGGRRPAAWAPVHYPLWRAVETLRSELEAKGIPGRALRFLSCFRPPIHNEKVGSSAYGRHIYGDAMDFFVDSDGNGMMDDLNGDGRVDRRDGLWLAALLEDLMADGKIPLGGIGVYTFDDSPRRVTMHFDLRGHRATWGYHTDRADRRSEFAWRSRRFALQDAAEEAARNAGRAQAGKPASPPVARDPLPWPVFRPAHAFADSGAGSSAIRLSPPAYGQP